MQMTSHYKRTEWQHTLSRRCVLEEKMSGNMHVSMLYWHSNQPQPRKYSYACSDFLKNNWVPLGNAMYWKITLMQPTWWSWKIKTPEFPLFEKSNLLFKGNIICPSLPTFYTHCVVSSPLVPRNGYCDWRTAETQFSSLCSLHGLRGLSQHCQHPQLCIKNTFSFDLRLELSEISTHPDLLNSLHTKWLVNSPTEI